MKNMEDDYSFSTFLHILDVKWVIAFSFPTPVLQGNNW